MFCYSDNRVGKKTTTKLRQIHVYFCWVFVLFHQQNYDKSMFIFVELWSYFIHKITKNPCLFLLSFCLISSTKLPQIHVYFCWAFVLFHQGIVITVTYIFIKKNNQNVIQQSNSVIQITQKEKIWLFCLKWVYQELLISFPW